MPHDPADAVGRRLLLGGAALIGWGAMAAETHAQTPVAGAPAAVAPAPANAIVVTLLGTGSPVPLPDRFGMSTLVQAGGMNLVFDAGRGCSIRLSQCGLSLGKLDAVFITHFHSDHLNGLPDLWLTGFLPPAFGHRLAPLEVYGPVGIGRIAATMRETFSDDIRIRLADEHVPEAGTQVMTHEFAQDGVMFERSGVKVTAFEVNHGPLIKPAYGYRIDFAGRSVLLSGDTRPDENLVAHGQGVDLLVHETSTTDDELLQNPQIRAILDHHTTPEQAGTIFTRTKPRLAVFSHIAEVVDAKHPSKGDAEIARRARTTYAGELMVGTDLTRFVVSPSGVQVQRIADGQGFQPA